VEAIPTLCHMDCMEPSGVCRVCSVEVLEFVRGRERRRMVPACRQPARDGMIVHTLESPDLDARARVRQTVRVLVGLLLAEHPQAGGDAGGSELSRLARRVGVDGDRYAPHRPRERPRDDSSQLMTVDRSACILCNRCIRACNEIKENDVIGRSGKGYGAYIAFDLDTPMLLSTCVSCGECMVSCPTTAMSFRMPVDSDWRRELLSREGYSSVSAEELHEHVLFRSLPLKYLQWNQGAVVRRRVRRGDVLCREGEYGATAFILLSGNFGIWIGADLPDQTSPPPARSWFARWRDRGRPPGIAPAIAPPDVRLTVEQLGEPDLVRSWEALLFGEMSCLNDEPRTATVAALEDGEVYVIRRNVLAMLERSATAVDQLKHVYQARALQTFLGRLPLFSDLDAADLDTCREFLRGKLELSRVQPGQVIFDEGDQADQLYVIYSGHVLVSQHTMFGERVLKYLEPSSYFGEFGLLDGTPRSATCTALDHVELVQVSGETFTGLLDLVPALRSQFTRMARHRVEVVQKLTREQEALLQEFIDQRLFLGQRLLVLDLEACTRCDECVKACAGTHGGVTRLVRDGLRFGSWLVASACRSCTDPVCLVGCPVDAIHRRGSHAIHIESHCIGCGTCAASCPFGNINMVGEEVPGSGGAGRTARVQQRATTCDLCSDIVRSRNDEVSCVHACPHQAAFRMDGATLLERAGGANLT
jgi:CRP-like cAMP-binding protein/Fe-S-cluster-containing dehydrogenase component